MFFGIPLSTKSKEGNFFCNFKFIESVDSTALLIQARMFDTKRLNKKIGMMKIADFENLKIEFRTLLNL